MKKGLLFGIALLLFPVVAAGCQDMSTEELMETLAPMEEKLNDLAEELEEALEEYLPESEDEMSEFDGFLGVFLGKATPEPTATPKPTNTPTSEPTNTPKPTSTNTPTPEPTSTLTPELTNTPTPEPTSTPTPTKPNSAYCDHEYEVTELVEVATDYAPGLRKYSCMVCGKEIENSYALPHYVDIGNGQTATVYGYWDLEKSAEMLRLLNEWRIKNGVPAVQDGMDGTARMRALECAYFYSHTRPNGERCFSAYEVYGTYAMAENIAAGYRGPEDVTNGWINSKGHNKNMLNATYRYASVSMFVVVNDSLFGEVSELKNDYQYGLYYSQNFWE